MNIASQLFKRATFPLGGNNVFVQNLLRKLSTCCFFRMSLCLQLIKRPMFTAEPAGISSGMALSAGSVSATFLSGYTMSSCQSYRLHANRAPNVTCSSTVKSSSKRSIFSTYRKQVFGMTVGVQVISLFNVKKLTCFIYKKLTCFIYFTLYKTRTFTHI